MGKSAPAWPGLVNTYFLVRVVGCISFAIFIFFFPFPYLKRQVALAFRPKTPISEEKKKRKKKKKKGAKQISFLLRFLNFTSNAIPRLWALEAALE